METRKAVTLLLVRHGQAQSNVSRILTSYPEAKPMPLSPTGRKEVEETAQKLKGTTVAALFASPLTRTQETASIISKVVGVPITTDHRLRETDFGVYNNTSYNQFFLRYPHPSLREEMDEDTQAEGLLNVRARVKEFLQFLQQEYPGKTVILVTHADAIREIMTVITKEGRSWNSVATGSVSSVSLESTATLE